jgi:hypothetical protein
MHLNLFCVNQLNECVRKLRHIVFRMLDQNKLDCMWPVFFQTALTTIHYKVSLQTFLSNTRLACKTCLQKYDKGESEWQRQNHNPPRRHKKTLKDTPQLFIYFSELIYSLLFKSYTIRGDLEGSRTNWKRGKLVAFSQQFLFVCIAKMGRLSVDWLYWSRPRPSQYIM